MFLSVALLKVQVVNALSQSSAVHLFCPLNVVRQSRALDPDVFEDAAPTNDSLFDVPVTFPIDNLFEIALFNYFFNEWKWFVVVCSVGAAGYKNQTDCKDRNYKLHL